MNFFYSIEKRNLSVRTEKVHWERIKISPQEESWFPIFDCFFWSDFSSYFTTVIKVENICSSSIYPNCIDKKIYKKGGKALQLQLGLKDIIYTSIITFLISCQHSDKKKLTWPIKQNLTFSWRKPIPAKAKRVKSVAATTLLPGTTHQYQWPV